MRGRPNKQSNALGSRNIGQNRRQWHQQNHITASKSSDLDANRQKEEKVAKHVMIKDQKVLEPKHEEQLLLVDQQNMTNWPSET